MLFEQKEYTNASLRILMLAKERAYHFHSPVIGTEHLLAGIIEMRGTLAYSYFSSFDIDSKKINEEILKFPNAVITVFDKKNMTLSPKLEKVLKFSKDLTQENDFEKVGTECLLLALLHEVNSVALAILENLKIEYDLIFQQIVNENKLRIPKLKPKENKAVVPMAQRRKNKKKDKQ
ncbi:MAG: Clp protease N-terminal domain-containing protein, partial [Lactovum sp.]